MTTRTVPPPAGSARRRRRLSLGASTQPKLLTTPLTTSPWPGVSIAPNGRIEAVVGAGNRLGAEQGRMPVAIVCVGIERERALPQVREGTARATGSPIQRGPSEPPSGTSRRCRDGHREPATRRRCTPAFRGPHPPLAHEGSALSSRRCRRAPNRSRPRIPSTPLRCRSAYRNSRTAARWSEPELRPTPRSMAGCARRRRCTPALESNTSCPQPPTRTSTRSGCRCQWPGPCRLECCRLAPRSQSPWIPRCDPRSAKSRRHSRWRQTAERSKARQRRGVVSA